MGVMGVKRDWHSIRLHGLFIHTPLAVAMKSRTMTRSYHTYRLPASVREVQYATR